MSANGEEHCPGTRLGADWADCAAPAMPEDPSVPSVTVVRIAITAAMRFLALRAYLASSLIPECLSYVMARRLMRACAGRGVEARAIVGGLKLTSRPQPRMGVLPVSGSVPYWASRPI
jgi:hypothetical protein